MKRLGSQKALDIFNRGVQKGLHLLGEGGMQEWQQLTEREVSLLTPFPKFPKGRRIWVFCSRYF